MVGGHVAVMSSSALAKPKATDLHFNKFCGIEPRVP